MKRHIQSTNPDSFFLFGSHKRKKNEVDSFNLGIVGIQIRYTLGTSACFFSPLLHRGPHWFMWLVSSSTVSYNKNLTPRTFFPLVPLAAIYPNLNENRDWTSRAKKRRLGNAVRQLINLCLRVTSHGRCDI